LVQSLAVVVLGIGLIGAALALPNLSGRRKKSTGKKRARPAAPAAPASRPGPAAPEPHEAGAAKPATPVPSPEPEPAGEPEKEKDEPRPDLPDWMVEDELGAEDDSPFADAPASAAPSGGDLEDGDDGGKEDDGDDESEAPLEMDVPDLDQILAGIEKESSESGGEESEKQAESSGPGPGESGEPGSEGDGAKEKSFELEPDLPSDSAGDAPESPGSVPGPDDDENEFVGGLELEPESESESESEPELAPDSESAPEPEPEVPPRSDSTDEAVTRREAEPDEGLELGDELDLGADLDGDETSGKTPDPDDAPPNPDRAGLELLDSIRDELSDDDEDEGAGEPVGAGEESAVADEAATPEPDTGPAEPREAPATQEDEESPAPQAGGPRFAPELFHDDAIRGVFDDELDVERAQVLGRAIGTLAGRRGHERFVVGRDGRFSGPVLLSALIRGLRDAGADVIELGALPTPLLWFGALELAEGCGVMVTASHHDSAENGFLVMLAGEVLCGSRLVEIDRIAAAGEFREGEEGQYDQQEIVERYIARLSAEIQLERPLKVVVDCANGISGSVAPSLLEAAGVEVIPLYCDVDGSFPNHPADPALAENLEDLRLCVRNFHADAGIAFDADGDALAMVSEQGEILRLDRLLMLVAEPILSSRPDAAVVVDVRCPAPVQRWIEQAGGRVAIERTGPAHVARRMRSEQAVLGLAMSTHLLVADRWYDFEDAFHAAARVLERMAQQSGSAGEALASLPEYRVTPELPMPVENGAVESLIERLAESGDFGQAERTTVDGLRIDYPDRWGLIRVTGSGKMAGLSFGADDSEALNRIKTEFREQLHAIDPDLTLPY
ncbi:MAG: hypothetical protein ACOCSR_05270, partial [Wenzhouxiangella sp.]